MFSVHLPPVLLSMTSGNNHTDRTHTGAAVYHRRQSPTQSAEMAALQESSGEIWGTYDRVMGGRSPFSFRRCIRRPVAIGNEGNRVHHRGTGGQEYATPGRALDRAREMA